MVYRRVKRILFQLLLPLLIYACVKTGAPVPDKQGIIQKIYPEQQDIIKVVFKDKDYFVQLDYNKIHRIFWTFQSEKSNRRLYVVLDKYGRLLEIIQYPEMEKQNLTDKQLFLSGELPASMKPYSREFNMLKTDLTDDWEEFIKRITLKIHKVDATSQATP